MEGKERGGWGGGGGGDMELVRTIIVVIVHNFYPFSATFDYEEDAVYNDLTLIVEDDGITNKRRSIPTPITVGIRNLNDEPTVFDQPVYSE